ncbi:MAG: hypothetical protein R3C12_15400 [Planctomycetaceae bacterium]
MDTTLILAKYCDKSGPSVARFLTGGKFMGIFETKFTALITV